MDRLSAYRDEIAWYLKRPRLYPEFLRTLKSKLLRAEPAPDTRRQATEWCAAQALDKFQAILQITGRTHEESLVVKFAPVFLSARQKAAACPVRLGGAANLDLLYWIAEHLQARTVIETGVALGWSSLAMLLSLSNRPGSLLASTDMPCRGLDADSRLLSSEGYVGCVVPDHLKNYWRIYPFAYREGLPMALNTFSNPDMCHYDSDKSYAGRSWAYPKLWDALRAGGYLISDDIGDNLALRDFCIHVNQTPIIVVMPADPLNPSPDERKYVSLLCKC